MHEHSRLVRWVALSWVLGESPVDLIATAGLATDAPDEGSGPAR